VVNNAVDFDDDGVPDNINFIIKRIKVWTSASAPGYRSSTDSAAYFAFFVCCVMLKSVGRVVIIVI